METLQPVRPTYEKIREKTRGVDLGEVKKVLLLYEEEIVYIGDCCIRFDKFKYLRFFLNHAAIDVNFRQKKNYKFYDGLLRNNPYLNRVTATEWPEIDFQQYDAVFCAAYDEERLLAFLDEAYGAAIHAGRFGPAVFSVSELLLKPAPHARYIFPVHPALTAYLKVPRPGELYISRPEQQWADGWLRARGVGENDNLLVLCDSTSSRDKMVRINVYFEFLTALLQKPNTKVLLFDEAGIGKEAFYKSWLGARAAEKLIFSTGQSLREDLCLLGAKNVKLIFGPCTGLMHCASSIYNHYVNEGMAVEAVPLLITYTGRYSAANKNADFWWGNSPLVRCLLLKKRDHQPRLTLLSSLSPEEKNRDDSLPCSEYTAQMLIDFVDHNLVPS
jgi:hypothetical protein